MKITQVGEMKMSNPHMTSTAGVKGTLRMRRDFTHYTEFANVFFRLSSGQSLAEPFPFHIYSEFTTIVVEHSLVRPT